MATERQIAANRLNAQRSTGPRTEAGKAVSRRNALFHGLTAKEMLLDGEDGDGLEELREDLRVYFRPVGVMEEELLETLGETMWRLRRAPTFEAALLEWIKYSEDAPMNYVRLNPPLAQGRVANYEQKVLGRSVEKAFAQDFFVRMSRYEAHLLRQIEKVLELLRKSKSERLAESPGNKIDLNVDWIGAIGLLFRTLANSAQAAQLAAPKAPPQPANEPCINETGPAVERAPPSKPAA